MKLWQKVLIGMCLGILVGWLFSEYKTFLDILNIGGQMFMRLIRMLMGPMIFCVLCAGILNVGNVKSFKGIGLKIIGISLLNTCFAITFSILLANLLKPGKNFDITKFNLDTITNIGGISNANEFNIKDFICNVIPDNVFLAFTTNNLLQIVFFSVFTGLTCQFYNKYSAKVKRSIDMVSDILFDMMGKIINLSPYGAFCLMAYATGMQGANMLIALSKLIYTKILALFLQYIIFGLSIVIFCRKSPIPFYKKSLSYQVLAFSISSSKLVLPKTISVCQNSLGISNFGAKVALPLATAFNITGSGIDIGISAIFFAQIYDVQLALINYCYIIFLSTVGAIGCSGVPGLSLVMLPIVLQSINVPAGCVILLIGVDRISDMLRTMINITGDVVTAMIVDHSEKKIDYSIYEAK